MLDLEYERVLVTGGNGFLGGHIMEALRARGCTELLAPPHIECDLTIREEANTLFESFKPTVVFHLAGVVGGIGANMAHPGKFFYENSLMGIHVIDLCQKWHVKRVIVAGTVCSYALTPPLPFREEYLWHGYPEATNAPYGISKLALLTMLHAYRTEYGLKGLYLIPVNLFGPRDNFNPETSHVIPAMIKKMIEAKRGGVSAVTLWGNGKASREFLYVADAAEAFVLAAERYDGLEPINLGTGSEITISGLARNVARATGYMGEIVWDPSKPNGQPRRCIDSSRAAQLLRWKASTGFLDGLRKTIAWYETKVNPNVPS